jgi:hypothetical protein
MRKQFALGFAAVLATVIVGTQATTPLTAHGAPPPVPPIVFQAAGPSIASIQSMVDAFRAALGGVNNGTTPGPLDSGRREINWDGGGSTATSPAPTPFDGFLAGRGARFTTPGTGFVQAPVEGIATTFANPAYADIFQTFSPVRLFSPVGANITETRFFVPGGGELPAATTAFGAVFTDVDAQFTTYDSAKRAPTVMFFLDAAGQVIYTAGVPASAGDASLSFVGVLFDDPRIARVRIRTGHVAPGPSERATRDIVMMDDFIYGEPQLITDPVAVHRLSQPE